MKTIILAFVLSIVVLPSFAENQFTGEVMLGIADQKTQFFGAVATGDALAVGVRLAYKFNEYIAVELGYQDYGTTDETVVDQFGDTINDKFEVTAKNLGVKAALPKNKGFTLIGRFGLSSWEYELRETDSSKPGQLFVINDSGTDYYYGFGAQYDLSEVTFVGFEYTVTILKPTYLGVVSMKHDINNILIFIGANF